MRIVELEGEPLIVASYALPSAGVESLTSAEREVARLVVEGASNKTIAAKRGTSDRTVANQIASIHRKLGVHSRVEMALALARDGAP